MENNEDFTQKSRNIFTLINKYRANPKELARYLERLKRYLDKNTNILSEPDKVQIQMVEGESVFNEAINFLKSIRPLEPLEWDENLARSAQEHVDDIGPKGLLLYQSSDGTEPEDRITKYGNYVESLGENIDFGPNDELGVIVSLTLDDGEEERPHRDNLFKNDYKKIGIACGPHQTEFQMCVMDLAFDFYPKGSENEAEGGQNVPNQNENVYRGNDNQNPNVKLSLDNNEYKNEGIKNNVIMPNIQGNGNLNEIDQLAQQVKAVNASKRILKKTVEITTKVTYTYEDGSTKVVNETKSHVFE